MKYMVLNLLQLFKLRCSSQHSQGHNLTLAISAATAFTTVCAIAARYPLPSSATPLDSIRSGADQFWHTLSTGANLPVTVPVSRWDIDDVYSPEASAKNMCAPILQS